MSLYPWFTPQFIVENLVAGYRDISVIVADSAAIGPPFGYQITVDVLGTSAQKKDTVAFRLQEIGQRLYESDKNATPRRFNVVYIITKMGCRNLPSDTLFEFRGFTLTKEQFEKNSTIVH